MGTVAELSLCNVIVVFLGSGSSRNITARDFFDGDAGTFNNDGMYVDERSEKVSVAMG